MLMNKLKLYNVRHYHSENVFGFKRKVKNIYHISDKIAENRAKQCNFYRLVTAYRKHGHKCADINPVSLTKQIR